MKTRYSSCLLYVALSPSDQVRFVPGRTNCQGHTVAHLVVALRYKSEVAVSIHEEVLEFFVDLFLPAALWPCFDLHSDGNEYQIYLLEGDG